MKIFLGDMFEVEVEEGDHIYAEEYWYEESIKSEMGYIVERDHKVIFESLDE